MKSNSMNQSFVLVLYFAIFLLLVGNVGAVGILPAQKEITLDSSSYSYDMIIVNTEDFERVVDMKVEGSLRDFVTLSENSFLVGPNAEKDIVVNVDIGSLELFGSGEHVSKILATERSADEEALTAKAGVASKLVLYKPEQGAILVPKLYAANFNKNQKGNFLVEIKNKGLNAANGVVTEINVLSHTGTKVWSDSSSPINVGSGKTENVNFEWIPEVENGKYVVEASVSFGNSVQKVRDTFYVGGPRINVDSITAQDFGLNKIVEMQIMLSSDWSEKISDVRTKMELIRNNETLFATEIGSVDIEPLGNELVTGYLDTKGVELGEYKIRITLEYLGKSEVNVFDVMIYEDALKIMPATGLVVDKTGVGEEEGGNSTAIIVIVVLIVVIVYILLFLYFVRMKKIKK